MDFFFLFLFFPFPLHFFNQLPAVSGAEIPVQHTRPRVSPLMEVWRQGGEETHTKDVAASAGVAFREQLCAERAPLRNVVGRVLPSGVRTPGTRGSPGLPAEQMLLHMESQGSVPWALSLSPGAAAHACVTARSSHQAARSPRLQLWPPLLS